MTADPFTQLAYARNQDGTLRWPTLIRECYGHMPTPHTEDCRICEGKQRTPIPPEQRFQAMHDAVRAVSWNVEYTTDLDHEPNCIVTIALRVPYREVEGYGPTDEAALADALLKLIEKSHA